MLGRRLHDGPEVTEADHAALADGPHVGREDLDAREARLDGFRELIDDVGRDRALEHHVEAVIRVALAPDRLFLVDRASDRQARLPDGEVDERGRPAADRGAADLLGRGARHQTAPQRGDRPVGVHVWVDAAGDDELASGVHDAAGVAGQRAGRADGDDALALDTDLPGAHALGSHDLSTADHEIEHGCLQLLRRHRTGGL